jgi:Flp pilus assembly protein TadG
LLRDPRGSVAVESIFAIVLLLMLTLGVVQIVLVLYGRNVVIAAAHEAARAAIELGRTPEEGRDVAIMTMHRAAGGLLKGMNVRVGAGLKGARYVVTVDVAGTMRTLGPVPVPVPISASATAVREELRASK